MKVIRIKYFLSKLNIKIYQTVAIFFVYLTLSHIVNAQIKHSPTHLSKTMAFVPAGTFIMGSTTGAEDEKPEHPVFVKAFWLDILPVTNADFATFLNTHPLKNIQGETYYDDRDADARIHLVSSVWLPDIGYENHPVNEVSWIGGKDYCHWLNKRLPTESEWEKAARGLDGRKYPWGNADPQIKFARYDAPFNASVPVDAYPDGASPYGILDMAGNQWEWVSSMYRAYPYQEDDGREDQQTGPIRVTRGGGHDSNAQEITSTHRGRYLSRNPKAGHHNIGFRCAKS